MAMNKWVKRKWLKALKSGEYAKGRNALAYTNYETAGWEYCCLGVLVCEMAPEFARDVNEDITVGHGDAKSDTYLPDDLAIMYGLDYDVQRYLASKNDASDDFGPVIAYIEENL
jgi:hypothetical protein